MILHLAAVLADHRPARRPRRHGHVAESAQRPGRELRDEPGLRRPVHVQGSRCGRPHHAREVAVLLRQEEGPPRPDHVQDHDRPGGSVPEPALARHRRRGPHPVDRAAGDHARLDPARRSSRPRSATRASRSTSGTRTACNKPYENIGTQFAKSAAPQTGVRARARPQRRSTRSSSEGRRSRAASRSRRRARTSAARRESPVTYGEATAAKAAFQRSGASDTGGRPPDDRHRPDRGTARRGHPGGGEAIGFNVDPRADGVHLRSQPRRRRQVRHVRSRLVGTCRPGRQHLPIRQYEGLAERRRLLNAKVDKRRTGPRGPEAEQADRLLPHGSREGDRRTCR